MSAGVVGAERDDVLEGARGDVRREIRHPVALADSCCVVGALLLGNSNGCC